MGNSKSEPKLDAAEAPLIDYTDKGKKQSKQKYNDPHTKALSDDLQNGPIEQRGCTDCLFLILFIAFWVGFFIACIFGFKHGQPNLIATPYDFNQNHCGYDSGFEEYPLIYYSSYPDAFSKTNPYGQFVCVKSCPTGNDSQTVSCSPKYNFTCQQKPTQQMGLICVPDVSKIVNATTQGISEAMNYLAKIGTMNSWIHDLKSVWLILVASLFIALVIAILNLALVYYIVTIVIWGSIIAFNVAMILCGYMCWHLYSSGEALQFQGHTITSNGSYLKAAAIILWIITVVSILIFLCSFKQINRAIDIMKATIKYMRKHLWVLIVPLFFVLIGIVFFVYWIVSTVYVASAGGPKPPGTLIKTPFTNILWNQTIKGALAYNIIALIWTIQFLTAFSQYVLAHSACEWYFNHKSKSLVSFYVGIRYHLGSLALGSFILTLVFIIRIILAILFKYLKETSSSHTNAILNVIFKCVNCYMDCFTRFLQYLNEQAYIMMSISGKNFCSSAVDGFCLMIRNSVQFASLQYVAVIIITLGKIFIALATAFVGYLIITRTEKYSSEIYSPIVPTFFFGLIAYLMASFIMSVLSVSAHAILMCFCVELEFEQKPGSRYISKAPEDVKGDLQKCHQSGK